MSSGSRQQPRLQEQGLLNHSKRLERTGSQYSAVWIHFTKLFTFQHLPECVHVVRTMVAREAKKFDASLFTLFNQDLFIVYPRTALTNLDAVLARVCEVLKNDPFFASGDEAQHDFYTYFDLDDQFGEAVECVESLVQARAERDTKARTAGKGDGAGKPLDLTNLATIEKAIAQADLSSMTSR